MTRFERILLTRIDVVIANRFSWIFRCIKNVFVTIRLVFYDVDTWEKEGEDYDDMQLHKLGLDIEKINNDKMYWEYNIGER